MIHLEEQSEVSCFCLFVCALLECKRASKRLVFLPHSTRVSRGHHSSFSIEGSKRWTADGVTSARLKHLLAADKRKPNRQHLFVWVSWARHLIVMSKLRRPDSSCLSTVCFSDLSPSLFLHSFSSSSSPSSFPSFFLLHRPVYLDWSPVNSNARANRIIRLEEAEGGNLRWRTVLEKVNITISATTLLEVASAQLKLSPSVASERLKHQSRCVDSNYAGTDSHLKVNSVTVYQAIWLPVGRSVGQLDFFWGFR